MKSNNVFQNWTRDRSIDSYERELSPVDFHSSYKPFFFFCFGITFIAQGFSLLSEYVYFGNVFNSQLAGYYLFIATALFCGLLEVSKFFVIGFLFRGVFPVKGESKLSPALLII